MARLWAAAISLLVWPFCFDHVAHFVADSGDALEAFELGSDVL